MTGRQSLAQILVLVGLAPFLAACMTDPDYGQYFARLHTSDGRQQVQQIAATSDRTDLLRALIYAVITDRTDLATAALDRGADPNGRLTPDIVRSEKIVVAQIEAMSGKKDALWTGDRLEPPIEILGTWCSRDVSKAGRCAKSAGNTSEFPAPYPVVVLARSPEMLELLMTRGAKLDQDVLDGTFAVAAQQGLVPVMERLSKLGARPDAMTANGLAPMHWAIMFSRSDAVAWLLEKGINPHTGFLTASTSPSPQGGTIYRGPGFAQTGYTPLHLAVNVAAANRKIDQILMAPVVLRVYPGSAGQAAGMMSGDRIMAVNGQPVDNWAEWVRLVRASPQRSLTVTVERNGGLLDLRLVPQPVTRWIDGQQRLIGRVGTDLDTNQPDLEAAHRYRPGSVEIARLLIDAGVDVNARGYSDEFGMFDWWKAGSQGEQFDRTPLHVAYDHQAFQIAADLEAAGADASVRLASGETPAEVTGVSQYRLAMEVQRQEEQLRRRREQERRQAASGGSGLDLGQMLALGGVAAITAYGAGQGMGADALAIGAGTAADIMTNGQAGGLASVQAMQQQQLQAEQERRQRLAQQQQWQRQDAARLDRERAERDRQEEERRRAQQQRERDLRDQQQKLIADMQRATQPTPGTASAPSPSRTAGARTASASSPVASTQRAREGCWSIPEPPKTTCVASSSRFSGNQFIVTHENICGERIVVRMCNDRAGQEPSCGQSGIMPGRTNNFTSYDGSTGSYTAQWIGSKNSVEDWSCVSQLGWQD
jgi:hypothetical protein